MPGILLISARTILVALSVMLAFEAFRIVPCFAQRDPLDLAQAGFLAKDRRDFPTAIRLFDEALKHGSFADKQRGLLLYSRGVSYEALGIRDRALLDFEAAVALIPDFPNVYLYRGIIWGEKSEYQRAIQDFLVASKLNPNDPLAFNNLGNVYEKLGDVDLAIENFGRAISLRPDYAQAYYNRAHAHALKQDHERAIADYDHAILLEPTNAEAYVNRAIVKLSSRDVQGALADLDTAIKLNPRDVSVLSNRASVNLAIEKYGEASNDFDRALAIDPDNAATYLGRGQTRLYSGAIDDSIEDFRTAVRLRPSNPYPVIWLHIARVHKGESDREEFARNAMAVDRGAWPGAMLDMYLGLVTADKVKGASQQGTNVERSKRQCEANFFLGELALHSGQVQRARDAFREVMSRCGPAEAIYSAAVAEAKLLPPQ